MSDEIYEFQASGEACPICAALDGQVVEGPGYTPHDGCTCQTVLKGQQGDCEWDFTESGRSYTGGQGWGDVIIGVAVEVTCPDGSVLAVETQFDGTRYSDLPFTDENFDAWNDEYEGVAEEAAQELCDQCQPEEPFRCC